MNVLSALLLTFFLSFIPQATASLPDPAGFLAEFRKTLHSDGLILSRYTYNMKDTRIQLDSNKKVQRTDVNVYEVFPAVEAWQTHKRLISRNGVALTPQELEKQDREQEKKAGSQARKLEKKTAKQIEEARAKELREDEELIQDIFAMYDVQLMRRDVVDEHPAIVLRFSPKAGFKAKTGDGKMWQRIAGEAWVSETDHQLIRVDAQTIDSVSVSISLGMLRAPKGSRIIVERRKFNDEVWLPARIEGMVGIGSKGPSLHQIVEYSDHKKFSVETTIRIP